MGMSVRQNPVMEAVAVTPSDTTVLAKPSHWIMVTVAGNVAVTLLNGAVITFPGLQPGNFYAIQASKIMSTGTTATGIIACN